MFFNKIAHSGRSTTSEAWYSLYFRLPLSIQRTNARNSTTNSIRLLNDEHDEFFNPPRMSDRELLDALNSVQDKRAFEKTHSEAQNRDYEPFLSSRLSFLSLNFSREVLEIISSFSKKLNDVLKNSAALARFSSAIFRLELMNLLRTSKFYVSFANLRLNDSLISSSKKLNLTFKQNKFKFHSVLGEGNHGKVLKVSQNGVKFACKVIKKAENVNSLKPETSIKPGKSQREVVENEVKILKILANSRSQNVIKFQKFFEDEENFYVLTNCVEFGQKSMNLQYLIVNKLQNIFEISKILKIIKHLSYAIQDIHEMGIIHRDIKPANLLLDLQENELKLKLCDFGLARIMPVNSNYHHQKVHRMIENEVDEDDDLTKYIGTPSYAAPEQLRSQNYNFKVDIYSFGVILLELLNPKFGTRMELFKVLNKIQTKKIKKEMVPIDEELIKITSPDSLSLKKKLQNLVRKSVELESKSRYSSREVCCYLSLV